MGTQYGALDKTFAAPEASTWAMWSRADLNVPITIGIPVRVLGVEVSVRDVKADPPLDRPPFGAPTAGRQAAIAPRKVVAQFHADIIVHPPWQDVGLATWSMHQTDQETRGISPNQPKGPGILVTNYRTVKAGRFSDTLYVLGQQPTPRMALLFQLPYARQQRLPGRHEPVVAFILDLVPQEAPSRRQQLPATPANALRRGVPKDFFNH
jgi:hypothetical protein